jgi:hypothetical protein|nr:MAG TPA: hypothetical protein [Caudoviricetes sp.]
MKKKILSLILATATILTSYTVSTIQPTQTVNASTPKQISITNAIPICDIAGYFYDKYGYLCFELGDTTKQFNKADGYSYSKICEKLPHLKDLDENKIYPLTAKVTKVNKKKNVVTVQDYSGNKWKFRGCEDYEDGDIVSMLMDSNGTEKVTDDIILQVRYSGAEW